MASPKVPMIITYHKPGTHPPLFVAGTFSEQQWEPQEMDYTSSDDGEYTFKKEISVASKSKIQYKFRIGHGDWWVLDENTEAITDNAGNRNNVVTVPSQEESTNISVAESDVQAGHLAVATEEEQKESASVDDAKSDNHQFPEIDGHVQVAQPVKLGVGERNHSNDGDDLMVKRAESRGDKLEDDSHQDSSSAEQVKLNDQGSHLPQSIIKDGFVESLNETPKLRVTAGMERTEGQGVEEDINSHAMNSEVLPKRSTINENLEPVRTDKRSGDEEPTEARMSDVLAALPDQMASSTEDHKRDEELVKAENIQSVAIAAKEIFNRWDTRSGASTPSFARTAAEVADSAALLDKEDLQPDVPDDVAGKTGLRRLSVTPIPEVARTAAEVADSAQALDSHENIFELELRPSTYGGTYDDEDIHGEHKPPLFSHECIGMEQDESHEKIHEMDHHRSDDGGRDRTGSGAEYNIDVSDLNDPTLEQFPSSRTDILNTVRKIETGLGEDRSFVEGVPPSPIIGVARRGSNDILGDFYATSPIASSSGAIRSQERLRVSRSHGSTSSLSLQSISEAEEPELATDTDFPKTLRLSPSKPRLKALRTPDSDEDEGVVMKHGDYSVEHDRHGHESELLSPDMATAPRPIEPEIPPEPIPDVTDPIPKTAVDGIGAEADEALDETPATPKTILAENEENHSPRIVLQPVEEADQEVDDQGSEDEQGGSTASGPDTVTSTSLTKRVVPRGQTGSRPGTPASARSTHLQVDKENWFSAFFRVLFNWIGGFINRLCGGR